MYDETPTIVTIWLTIMPKLSILIFLLEIHSQIGNSLLTIFSLSLKNLLLISSLLSLIIGTIVGLAHTNCTAAAGARMKASHRAVTPAEVFIA